MEPNTAPAAIPPRAAFQLSCFPLLFSARHSTAANEAAAEAIQNEGRARERATARISDFPETPPNLLLDVIGSGNLEISVMRKED